MKRLLKIIGGVFLGLLILLISAGLVLFWFSASNTKDYGDNARILKAKAINYKKALIVYQPSRGSLTTKMADEIAKGINDAGYEVTINYPGKHMSNDVLQYDIVVFGSPVYMGQTSSVLTDYMKTINDLSNKKVMLFVTGGDLNTQQLNKMEPYLGGKKADEKLTLIKGVEYEKKAYKEAKKLAKE